MSGYRTGLNEILAASRKVDYKFSRLRVDQLADVEITVPVPRFHHRYGDIKSYTIRVEESEVLPGRVEGDSLLLATGAVRDLPSVKAALKRVSHQWVLDSDEASVKNVEMVAKEVQARGLVDVEIESVIAVGGGLVMNVASYVAEQLGCALSLWPTTLLSMADCSGGKVRLNAILDGRGYKHFYRSFYEPDEIVIDEGFLQELPARQIQIGLVEIIKHGVFQSRRLADFLLENKRRAWKDRRVFLKAALWAAALKAVCIEVDVEETEWGSRGILKAGHDISDRLEEESKFRIPHGLAVAIGIVRELSWEVRPLEQELVLELFDAYGIPTTTEAMWRFIRGAEEWGQDNRPQVER